MSVRVGLDVLQLDNAAALAGQRVGLVTNHTGRDARGRHVIEVLLDAPEVAVRALFSPEHGLYGRIAAGERVAHDTEATTGLPIFSLYGDCHRPAASMLTGLDTLVCDVQDVGARCCTMATTMAYCLEACADHALRFVVLDRPNPINGADIEGPLVEDEQRSFMGYLHAPIRHGLTLGELATMHRAQRRLEVPLQVVRCQGWRRTQWWDEIGREWQPPSPAMPSLTTATLYPGTSLLEGTNASEGRGTDTPFELIGAPWIDGEGLAAELNARALPGLRVEAAEFCPVAGKWTDEECGGVRLVVTDRTRLRPVALGLHLLDAIHRHNPIEFEFDGIASHLGNSRVIDRLKAFVPVTELIDEWAAPETRFRAQRKEWLLYE